MQELPYLLAVLLAIALFLRLDFVFYIIYVVGGAWLLARWATPRVMQRLQIRRRFSDHAFIGETLTVTLEVENTSRLPLGWLRLIEALPADLAMHTHINQAHTLRPRQTLTLHYDLHCTRRGYFTVGPLQASGGDFFGFAPAETRSTTAQSLTVYPRIVPLGPLALPARLPFGTVASHKRLFADPARPRGVRAYQTGDSLRHIHWTASAHSDELLVRQYAPAISLQSMILLNLRTADYERQRRSSTSEWGIELAASLAAALGQMRQAVGLAVLGRDPLAEQPSGGTAAYWQILPRPGRAQLMKVLETLARAALIEETQPFVLWAQAIAAPLAWGTTVLVITPSGDEATCYGLHRLVRAGLNVNLLVTEPYHRFEMVQARAKRLGITAWQVASEAELQAMQSPNRL
ncbi:MAG: DUF58 domain-containing protein [Caldilineales bacterium]